MLQAGEILCGVDGEMEGMVVEALVPGCMGSFVKAIRSEGGLNRGRVRAQDSRFIVGKSQVG